MAEKVRPIPEGYHSVTPYLVVKDGVKALEFYKKALGAEEVFRMPTPEGQIAHAELQIGDSRIMLADEYPDMGYKSPQSYGGSAVSLMLYVEDVDSFADRAVKAGMKVKREITNQFYGDRSGNFEDPFGHLWTIATHVEDVSEEEVRKRAEEQLS